MKLSKLFRQPAAAFHIAIVAACLSSIAEGRQTPNNLIQVAESGLKSIQHAPDWKFLGFASQEEASRATLGNPVQVYLIDVNKLANYKGGDLASILNATGKVIYPVLVNGRGRLLIELAKQGETWKIISEGQQDSAGALTELMKNINQLSMNSASVVFARLNEIKQQTYLVIGRTKDGRSAVQGQFEISILPPVPDLSQNPQVVPLNPPADASVSSINPNGNKMLALDALPPIAVPTQSTSAREYFRGLAPTAQKVIKSNKGGGPG